MASEEIFNGYAVIFNHYDFDKGLQSIREGTQEDVKSLMGLFEKYNIEIKVNPDFTLEQISAEVNRLKSFDFRPYHCFVVVILTHGNTNNILYSHDSPYNFNEVIVNPIVLNNSSLSKKPKIFLIQACKGSNYPVCFLENDAHVSNYTMPAVSDMFFAFSTYEGYNSKRDTKIGGPFIQSFCKFAIENVTRESINSIMYHVTDELAQNIKQVPTVTSTLRKPFIFGVIGREYFKTSLTERSACFTLNKAINLGHNELKDKAILFIGEHMRSVLKTDEFLTISKDALAAILSLEVTGVITEHEIFLAAMKWAARKCTDNSIDVSSINKRIQLGDLIKLIRFPAMTSKEFEECIKEEDNLLTMEEKFSLLLSIERKQNNNLGFENKHRKNLNYVEYSEIIFLNKETFLPLIPLTTQNQTSKFTFNKDIYLIGIYCGFPEKQQILTIEICNHQNITLNEEKFMMIPLSFDSRYCFFLNPVLLEAKQEYILKMNFENTLCNFYSTEHKTLLFSEDDVEIKFTMLSELFHRILFKILPE